MLVIPYFELILYRVQGGPVEENEVVCIVWVLFEAIHEWLGEGLHVE